MTDEHSLRETAAIARRADAEARADVWQRIGPHGLDLLRGERDAARGEVWLWRLVAVCAWGVVIVMLLT
jgi:hypothetical protein